MPEKDLKPLGLNGAPQPAAPASAPSTAAAATADAPSTATRTPEDLALGGGDDVAAWIAEHPETDESTAASTTDAAPSGSTVTPASASAAPGTASTAAPAAADAATPDATAAAAAAATPAPKTFEPTEKFALAEGVEWTREQVVAGLQQRIAFQNETKAYRDAIGLAPDVAARLLTPILQRLKSEPQTAAFVDAYLADPARAEYLGKCLKFYDDENGAAAPTPPAQPTQPPAAQLDPQTRQTITELQAWKRDRDATDARDRFNRELTDAQTTYPVLATNRMLLQQVALFASNLAKSDPKLGLPDAVARMKDILEAVQAQANAAAASGASTAAPTAAPVPALLTSPGASPTSMRPAPSRPDPNVDPVDAWMSGGAVAAGFK